MFEQDKFDPEDSSKARDLLRIAIESLSEGFALYDEDRRLVMFNKRYKEMNSAIADILEPGLDWEILIRECARRGVYADAVGREDAWVTESLENGIEYIQNYELRHSDGTYSEISVHPTELGGFVVTRNDITDKKNAEAMEQDRELLVRTVLDASSAVVVMARIGDGEVLYKSPGAKKLFGTTESAKQHYAYDTDRADYVTDLLADGQVDDYRITFVNGNGDLFQGSVSGRIAEYKGEETIVSSIIDLTEQLETEALIRQVLEACPVPVQMVDVSSGDILFSSPETKALFGETNNAIGYHPETGDGRQMFLESLRDRGFLDDYKMQLTNTKGLKFWAAVSARMIEFKGREVIVSNTRDLTNELALQAELESQRQLLFQNEKMSALGELLAGVAHELNNPLSVVVGHSLMLHEETQDPDAIRRIGKISGAAERCAKIVKTFLAMARQQPTKMEATDVNAVIATAIDVASYGEKADGLKITHKLKEGLPNVLVDGDQITQVIINLVLNAGQAISQSGQGNRIQVSSRQNRARTNVKIFVEDNGPGVPDNIKARIFEPFFTTKDIGDGTGIGLAFCHRIILSHGGQIWLDHDYEDGTRFCIKLPVAPILEEQLSVLKQEPRTGKNVKVLVVDDEVDVAELMSEILSKDGFQVDLAHSGVQAIKQLKDNRYDILLSDLNMPEMNGCELYDVIKSDFPDLQNHTGFITGDTMGTESQNLLRESKRPYLEKPVSPSELRDLVYSLLNSKEIAN